VLMDVDPLYTGVSHWYEKVEGMMNWKMNFQALPYK